MNFNPRLFASAFLICLLNCGLFYKGLPKNGEFCYVLAKPPLCLFVNFESRKLIWEDKTYELRQRTRTEYLFPYQDMNAELLVTTENRVEIKIPNETTVSKFYMRKKEKYSSATQSK